MDRKTVFAQSLSSFFIRSVHKGKFRANLFTLVSRFCSGRKVSFTVSAGGGEEMKTIKKNRTVVLPSTGEEAEITAVTESGNELQAFDSLHPVVQSTQNDWSLVT